MNYHPRHRRARDERGDFTPAIIILLPVLLGGVIGLLFDGSYAVIDSQRLTSQASQAARVGADALNTDSLRDGGSPTVDVNRARNAVTEYLNQVGAPPGRTITVTGDLVTVRIEGERQTALLQIVLIDTLPISGEGSARSINADDDP